MDINREGARFNVVCKRCDKQFEVVRNWGGGIRRDGPSIHQSNPAKCNCGSLQLEIY